MAWIWALTIERWVNYLNFLSFGELGKLDTNSINLMLWGLNETAYLKQYQPYSKYSINDNYIIYCPGINSRMIPKVVKRKKNKVTKY